MAKEKQSVSTMAIRRDSSLPQPPKVKAERKRGGQPECKSQDFCLLGLHRLGNEA